jgi:thiamine biosynthesis lipoprotein
MGTVFSFDIRASGPAVGEALAAAVSWLHHVDEVFSTYRPGSVISRLRRREITIADCPGEVADVLRLCAQVEQATGGYFSASYGDELDPTGLVKGWAIERASKLLVEAGADRSSLNGGGDVQLSGDAAPGRPWRVGIAHPLRPNAIATIVTGRDLAIATSGTAERGTHIVDPHSGHPARELASITLVGRSLTMVDAYATAAFAMGSQARDWVDEMDGLEAFAITAAGATWHTRGFPSLSISSCQSSPSFGTPTPRSFWGSVV